MSFYLCFLCKQAMPFIGDPNEKSMISLGQCGHRYHIQCMFQYIQDNVFLNPMFCPLCLINGQPILWNDISERVFR